MHPAIRPDDTEVIFVELPDGLDGSNGLNGLDGSDGHKATDDHHTDDPLAAVSAQQDFGDLGVAPADTTTTTGIPSAAPSESDSAVPIAPKTAQPTKPINPINPILVEKATAIPATLYRRLDYLGIIPNDIRSHNVGASNYSAHLIQPWAIWLDYPELTSWDHDIIKRVLRTKSTDPRITDYEKIIHICQERIRQLRHAKPSD